MSSQAYYLNSQKRRVLAKEFFSLSRYNTVVARRIILTLKNVKQLYQCSSIKFSKVENIFSEAYYLNS